MAKEAKSLVVSGAGWIGGFAEQLIEALRDHGCTDEEIHSLVTRKERPAMGKIASSVADFIRQEKNTFRLVKIGDGRTTKEIVRDGNYNHVHACITSANFPARARKESSAEIVLLEFDCDPESSEWVITEAEKRGLVPPTYEDALYFGVEHPEVQRERPVVFLHEPWLGPDGRRNVLYLWGNAGYRKLSLSWFDDGWDREYRFAFVRK